MAPRGDVPGPSEAKNGYAPATYQPKGCSDILLFTENSWEDFVVWLRGGGLPLKWGGVFFCFCRMWSNVMIIGPSTRIRTLPRQFSSSSYWGSVELFERSLTISTYNVYRAMMAHNEDGGPTYYRGTALISATSGGLYFLLFIPCSCVYSLYIIILFLRNME
mgnify:CR=1 FL=1